MAKSDAPIIVVKRVKKGGHGHHGGAWKIAYADFVTAMMAFFLLMWVLGSTTAGDLAGISSYFQNPMRVSMSGGQGSGETTRIIKGGGDNISKVAGVEAKADADTEQRRISDSSVTDVENARKDRTKNEAVKSDIEKSVESDAELKNIKGQLFMDITSEGLRIQVVDEKGKPLFNSGGVVPTVSARRLLRVIGKSLNDNSGKIRIEGHTDAAKFSNGEAGYTNWELSSERANVARREMIAGGLAPSNVAQVIGFADTIPLNPADLSDPLNRRISITLLNKKPKKEEKPVQRPIERQKEELPKGAQEIPANLRAPAQFLSKDAPIAPAMDTSKVDKPATGKPAR
ncbi:flagellar motor protein MotB [Polynucleobacter sp. AP-Sving-400A-A2]|uniref:flagellar motor protein MotB n=1 Tax=Polynucleobacter sp. AP-Sving-400A-A2 TaxID=2081049 RepID=UPI001BFEB4C7|nr:flagellar motor protein MotB [Polynucleobacter sp. AP-Sving-400A-A2]QWE14999.1 flagellar motor protein MotB [Polynucleobacter sp. AP-Sving-400A-A2]